MKRLNKYGGNPFGWFNEEDYTRSGQGPRRLIQGRFHQGASFPPVSPLLITKIELHHVFFKTLTCVVVSYIPWIHRGPQPHRSGGSAKSARCGSP